MSALDVIIVLMIVVLYSWMLAMHFAISRLVYLHYEAVRSMTAMQSQIQVLCLRCDGLERALVPKRTPEVIKVGIWENP